MDLLVFLGGKGVEIGCFFFFEGGRSNPAGDGFFFASYEMGLRKDMMCLTCGVGDESLMFP